jgi:hypothetical protein
MGGRGGKGMRRAAIWLAAAAALGSVPVFGQSVISARSGLVSLVDGVADIGGVQIHAKPGSYPDLKENQALKTWDGRVEVLLNPGVFLRMGENSAVQMLRNRLEDTRIEFLGGRAVIEAAEISKGNAVTVLAKGAEISLKKAGIYRFDMEPARLRVFAGAATVRTGGRAIEVGAGKVITLEGEMAGVAVKFNRELTDSLDHWSRRRGEYVATANVSSAKSLLDSGYGRLPSAEWRWNPYFGTYTFIPGWGTLMSPYGYRYWSPVTVGRVFYHPPPASAPDNSGWNSASSSGYTGMSATSSGYSGTAASSNSSSSSSSPAAAMSSSASAAAESSSSVGHSATGGGGRGR